VDVFETVTKSLGGAHAVLALHQQTVTTSSQGHSDEDDSCAV
jgi:hypothetical protein